MLSYYLKIASRVLKKNTAYTLINILGLSVCFGVALILYWIVRFEFSFDTYHAKADRIYQLIGRDKFGEEGSHIPQGPIKALNEQIPGVEIATTAYRYDPQVIRVNNQNLKQEHAYIVRPDLLKILNVEWVSGSPENSLSQPYQVVLDEPTAQRLFRGNALGKQIKFDNELNLTVSGIIKKIPANSSFQMQMLVSFATLKNFQEWLRDEDYWGGGDSWFQGLVLLKPGVDAKTVQAGLTKMALAQKDRSAYTSYKLIPLPQSHFYTEVDNLNYAIPEWLLFALISIGGFIVLIGAINFINLATVQAIQRNKEVGVRKILGGGKKHILSIFFLETAIIVLVALGLGAGLANLFLPYTGNFLNTQVAQSDQWNLNTFLFLLALILLLIPLVSAYPAIILSRFKPIDLIRKQILAFKNKGISLRHSLVVTQFVIAQVLVICTLIGVKQINYFHQKNLGFDKSAIITVKIPFEDKGLKKTLFKQKLQQHASIEEVTYGLNAPASINGWWWNDVKYHGLPSGELQFRQQFVDSSYFKFYKIPLVAGRALTADDTINTILINEKAARDMGFTQVAQALGEYVDTAGKKRKIVGIVKDYHSQSLKEEMKPHFYQYKPTHFQLTSIRVNPHQKKAALKEIEQDFKATFPDNYFEYKFLDEDLRGFYGDEDKLANFLSLFSIIGILIGCLGLYGLVSFICVQKTKEIGIRKVLGASIANILALLTKEFLKLILIAMLIAAPIAWFMMHQFLAEYTYRIPMPWWIFIVSGAVAIFIALLTVSFHAIKAAVANPVDSLRSE